MKMKLNKFLKITFSAAKIGVGLFAVISGALIIAGTIGFGLPVACAAITFGAFAIAAGARDVVKETQKKKKHVWNPPQYVSEAADDKRKGYQATVVSPLNERKKPEDVRFGVPRTNSLPEVGSNNNNRPNNRL
jgi:hypothetical protein